MKINNSLINFLCISFGAILGSFIRFHVDNYLLVNLLGAYCVGSLLPFKVNHKRNLFFFIGFCGSLTTFSSWILDATQLLIKGEVLNSISLLVFVFISGCFAMILGFYLSKLIIRLKQFQ